MKNDFSQEMKQVHFNLAIGFVAYGVLSIFIAFIIFLLKSSPIGIEIFGIAGVGLLLAAMVQFGIGLIKMISDKSDTGNTMR